MKKEFNLWREGYNCSGGSATATFLATIRADSFLEAVFIYIQSQPEEIRKSYKPIIKGKIHKRIVGFTDWGCRIFDNETDARKSFG